MQISAAQSVLGGQLKLLLRQVFQLGLLRMVLFSLLPIHLSNGFSLCWLCGRQMGDHYRILSTQILWACHRLPYSFFL